MANESNKKVWDYGKNLFTRLNPDDISVAANWPVITTADINTKALSAVVSPLGVSDTSVCGMAGAASEAQHGVKPTVGLTAEQYEFAVYFRAGNKGWAYLENHTIANVSAYFNIATGAIGTVGSACTAATKYVGNSWYRCSIRFAGTAAASTFEISAADADGDKSFTGDGATANAYVWRPGVFRLTLIQASEEDEAPGLRTTDDGDILVGGLGEDDRALALNVSRASATRSTADRVALVQVIGADGTAPASGGAVDLVKVAGTTATSGAGAVTAGTLRITQASDSPEVTSLQILDNIVGTDGSAAPTQVAVVAGVDSATGLAQTLDVDDGGALTVVQKTWSPEVDSVNGWIKVRIQSRAPITMSPQVTAAVTTATEILSTTVIGHLQQARLWIYNSSAVAFNACTVYVRNYAGREYALDTATFATLGATTALSLLIPNGVYAIRVTAGSGTTSAAECEVTGQV